jgi:hypothetical protein
MPQLRIVPLTLLTAALLAGPASGQTTITNNSNTVTTASSSPTGILITAAPGTPDVTVKTGDVSSSVFHIFNANTTSPIVDLLRVQANGNVGIGTTSANYPLDINSNAVTPLRINSNNAPGLVIDSSGAHKFTMGVSTGSNHFISHSVANDVAFRADGGGKMLFSLAQDGSTNDLTLVGGKVGIGTASPSSYLTVQSGVAGSPLDIAFGRTAPEARFAIAAGPGQYANTADVGDAVLRVDSSSKRLHLLAGTGNPVVTITSANVGISSYLPTARFEIGSDLGPVQFQDLLGANGVTGMKLNMTGNGEIDVAGLKIGDTAMPTINAAGGTLYLQNSAGDVSIGAGTGAGAHGDLTVAGTIRAGTVYANYQDVAEWVPASESMPAGTVVVISDSANNTVKASTHAYDTGVAGVVSPAPGLLLGIESASKAKIATTGRVKVRVDATNHAIRTGDLLVTSDSSGMAMKSEPLDLGGVKIHRPGTLIGKALEPLAGGEGEILVLLSLQ